MCFVCCWALLGVFGLMGVFLLGLLFLGFLVGLVCFSKGRENRHVK